MIDLWPDDLAEERSRCPVGILREQAALLGEKTGGAVQGRVEAIETRDGTFAYSLSILAPGLPSYRYVLLSIAHGLAFYPVDISVAEEVLEEIGASVSADGRWAHFGERGYTHPDTEEAYVESLRLVLGAHKTRQVVTALLSQVEEVDRHPGEGSVGGESGCEMELAF